MELAQRKIEAEGRGVIIWLDQVGKDNGHMAEVLSASLKAEGVPQTEAYQRLGYEKDARSFVRAAEIIQAFEIASVKLMTNSPKKIAGLTDRGIKVSGIQEIYVSPDNADLHKTYLDKVNNQGHLIKTIGRGSDSRLK
jgi:GTP cyclohydrolase II